MLTIQAEVEKPVKGKQTVKRVTVKLKRKPKKFVILYVTLGKGA